MTTTIEVINDDATAPASDDEARRDRESVAAGLEKLQKERDALKSRLESISGWRKKFQAAQNSVATATAEFEKADAARKKAKAALDTAMAKEHELVSKFVHGEQLLPFDDQDTAPEAKPNQPATEANPVNDDIHDIHDLGAANSIEALLAKHIKKIVGKEVFEDSKARGQPLGLSDKQIEVIAAADIKTVGDLEKRISEDAWFLKNLQGFGEKAIDRLTDTLLAFRSVYPIPPADETTRESGE